MFLFFFYMRTYDIIILLARDNKLGVNVCCNRDARYVNVIKTGTHWDLYSTYKVHSPWVIGRFPYT